MEFTIRGDLHYCKIEDSFVFLDLRRDRYFLLQGRAAARLCRFLEGQVDAQSIAWLIDRNIVEAGAGTTDLGCSSIDPPSISILDCPIGRPSPTLIAEAVFTQLVAKQSLQHRPLLKILRTCARRKKTAVSRDSQSIYADIAGAFKQANRFISTTDQCLSRGLAAMRMLTRRRCAANLVIGVTKPFSAHCWIQHGDVVLTDPLDRVRPFQPIFVL